MTSKPPPAGRTGYTGAGDVPRSHVYPTGASLYFTAVAGLSEAIRSSSGWPPRKAASDAIMATEERSRTTMRLVPTTAP